MTACRKGYLIRREIPADLSAVEAVALEVREASSALCSSLDAFAVELLVREALTNAVLHGCRLDPKKSAFIALRLSAGRMVMVVREPGAGFDWRRQFEHSARDVDECGRGIAIYKALANRIRFNAQGNSLTLTKSFKGGNDNHG